MYNLHPKINDRLDSAQFANLHTFFVAARYMSFLQAADEMCLTASAVSHRIRRLENAIGLRLFQRLTRKISLTQEGEKIFKILQQTMGELTEALQPATDENIKGRIIVYARPSLAQSWLAPKFGDFSEKFPGVLIDLRVGNENIDFRSQNIDLAIDYANGEFPGLLSYKLMSERIAPVCSRAYADRYNLFSRPENISNCLLLHDSRAWNHAAYDAEWSLWINQNVPSKDLPERCYTFDRSDLCIVAAMNDVGIAIGREKLVQKNIDRGELVSPFGGFNQKSPYGYYLIHPLVESMPLRASVFLSWLKEICLDFE